MASCAGSTVPEDLSGRTVSIDSRCRILNLPPELRRMIWSACMVVGFAIPYATGVEATLEQPYVTLFRVSKAIHEEARPLLKLNKFIFLETPALQQFVSSPQRVSLLRRVHIELSDKDFDKASSKIVWCESEEQLFDARCNDEPEDENHPLRLRLLHHNEKKILEELWTRKLVILLEMTKNLEIAVGLGNCLCRKRCCSLRTVALCVMWRRFAAVQRGHSLSQVRYVNDNTEETALVLDEEFNTDVGVESADRPFDVTEKTQDGGPRSPPDAGTILAWESLPEWLVDIRKVVLEDHGQW